MNVFAVRLVRGAAFAVAGISVGASFFSNYLSTVQLRTAPLAPDSSSGIVNSVFLRGVTIYLDDFDYAVQTMLFPVSAVIGLLSAGVVMWANRRLRAAKDFPG